MLTREQHVLATKLFKALDEIEELLEEHNQGMLHVTLQRRTGEVLRSGELERIIGEGANGNMHDDLGTHLADAKTYLIDKLAELGVKP